MKLLTTIVLSTLFLFIFVPKAFSATLLLNPPFGNVGEGEDLNVDVVLQGQDELIDGVDALITYDVNILRFKEIKEGAFFSKYPIKTSDNGQVKITALAAENGVKIFGDITVATLVFEILDTGQTKLDFSFQAGVTSDSNVTLHGSATDALTEAKGGSYSVVATPERIREAQAKKAQQTPSPLLLFIPLLLLLAGGVWYYLKHRKPPPEDVFIPEAFPLDKVPKAEKEEQQQTPPKG